MEYNSPNTTVESAKFTTAMKKTNFIVKDAKLVSMAEERKVFIVTRVSAAYRYI